MKPKQIILVHGLLFFVLTTILFLLSETILNLIAPGYHQVEKFTSLLFLEVTGIFFLVTLSCAIFVVLSKKRKDHFTSSD